MSNRRWIHVNGIGGKGLAPVAALAHSLGWTVTGDDLEESSRTRALCAAGIQIDIGFNKQRAGAINVHSYSSNQSLSRLQLVNRLLRETCRRQIAVTGSFGKSTATSLIFTALSSLNASCYVGAELVGTLCGAHLGDGDLAVVEACEYKNSYQSLNPWMVVCLNIWPNHEDWFGEGTQGFVESFVAFVSSNADTLKHVVLSEQAATLLKGRIVGVPVHSVGTDRSCTFIYSIGDEGNFGTRIDMVSEGAGLGGFWVDRSIAGRDLIESSAIALVTAHLCGVSSEFALEALRKVKLPAGRGEVRYRCNDFVFVDDNARHPRQVIALAESLRARFPGHSLCFVASPWGRLNARDLNAWSGALSRSDISVILPVGSCSVDNGGAELPTAATELSKLLNELGGLALPVEGPYGAIEMLRKIRFSHKKLVVVT